jgi:ppGpp synthetase/RelA/SpoT-type nucleotidyltranferase
LSDNVVPLQNENTASAGDSDERTYDQAHGLAELGCLNIGKYIAAAIGKLGDPHLIRAKVSKPRIKELGSLRRKSKQHGWTVPEALEKARDFIGFQVICNNLQDAKRAYALLREELTNIGLAVSTRDYVRRPQRGGYRAIHLWFPYTIQAGSNKMTLYCEVQIRSLLQDAWAQLSRVDIYGGDSPPALARAMERLSERLHDADRMADGIRTRVAKPRRGRQPATGAPISAASIAFLYRHAFGSDPPEYLVQSTLNDFPDTPIRTDALAALLDDKEFLQRLKDSYREANRVEFDADDTLIFRWAVRAATHGRVAGVRAAKAEGRAEWQYIDRIYRSEALSSLPDDADDFVRFIKDGDDGDPGFDIETWADALGASSKCMCGEKLVDEGALADALIKRYRLKGEQGERARERITRAVSNSGVELEDGSGLCSYHWHVLHEED